MADGPHPLSMYDYADQGYPRPILLQPVRVLKSRASCGRFPPSFSRQVIIITGLNKLYDYVLALKMALDADM